MIASRKVIYIDTREPIEARFRVEAAGRVIHFLTLAGARKFCNDFAERTKICLAIEIVRDRGAI
ncbi:MAG TPA: hypothetical protein VND65_01790 [Candidatus Binatia bacterium]|nr:hypothetical protein [Candidatus Binatia bacterium]